MALRNSDLLTCVVTFCVALLYLLSPLNVPIHKSPFPAGAIQVTVSLLMESQGLDPFFQTRNVPVFRS